MPLTDAKIRNAKPASRTAKLSDGGGLHLQVTPAGGKYWRLAYRFAGKQKTLAIGVYPRVSLADARRARDDAKALLAAGEDPSAKKREARRAAEIASANTFEAVARDFVSKQANVWTRKYADGQIRRMELDLFPEIGARPIAEIEAPELLAALRRIEARGSLDMAARMRQTAGQVFRFGIACGLCKRDPSTDLRGALTPHKTKHMAAVKPEEFPELLRRIDGYDGDTVTRLALQFVALTFVRTSDLVGATWGEFDTEAGLWIIPAPRLKMKDGSDHVVPLAPQTRFVLEQLRALNGHSEFMFASPLTPKKPISNNTVLYALYRLGYHSRMTGHGFRTLASSILNESGLWSPDVIERQLAHYERNKVRGAYNRAEYLPQRRKMMAWYADHLDRLRAGTVTVVAGEALSA
jgi:integrase